MARQVAPAWLLERHVISAEDWVALAQQARAAAQRTVDEALGLLGRPHIWGQAGTLELHVERLKHRMRWPMPYPSELASQDCQELQAKPPYLRYRVATPNIRDVSLGGQLRVGEGREPLVHAGPLFAPYDLVVQFESVHWLVAALDEVTCSNEGLLQACLQPPPQWQDHRLACVLPLRFEAAAVARGWQVIPT